MAGGDHGNQRHETAVRRARVVELRNQGLGFREIAAEMKLGLATVWRHHEQAMRDIPAPFVAAAAEIAEQRKAEQLARIDLEREVVMGILEAEHVTVSNGKVIPDVVDHGPNLAAVDRLHKLDQQESDLLGLKAEQKLAVNASVRYELVGIDPADLT
jgi:hypothetical protein